MFVESAIVLAGVSAVALNLTDDYRSKKREIKEIKYKWNLLMDSIGGIATNSIKQAYSLLEIFPKHYGFDCIISLPYGTHTQDLRKLLPKIEVVYGANSVVEPSDNGKSAYMRVHYKGVDISNKDNCKIKWYSYFQENKFRNANGETYKLNNGKDIFSPNDKELVLGTKYTVQIPSGLTYDSLKNEEVELSKVFGLCQVDYDSKKRETTCELINSKVPDDEKFVPIKVNPWELYIGMEHNWTPIVLNYIQTPNGLIAGRVGSGKTVSLITGILNLVCTCDNWDLYIAMIGEKQDLAIFKNAKQTKYYAQSSSSTIKLIKHLTNEMNRRNKLFSDCNKMCFNIKRYNTIMPKEKQLNYIHLIVDELADLMEDDSIQDILWNLIRKSRSAGIYLTLSSQRFSLANVSAEVKANLSCKVIFKMMNSASASTVISGDNLAQRVVSLEPSREFLVEYQDGIKVGKTLQLTENQMIELMKDNIEDNKIMLDLNGNIVEEKSEKVLENEQKQLENVKKEEIIEEKTKKLSRFEQYQAKKEGKVKKEEERIKYLESVKNEILKNSIKKKGE